jgi:hypothetical protein
MIVVGLIPAFVALHSCDVSYFVKTVLFTSSLRRGMLGQDDSRQLLPSVMTLRGQTVRDVRQWVPVVQGGQGQWFTRGAMRP